MKNENKVTLEPFATGYFHNNDRQQARNDIGQGTRSGIRGQYKSPGAAEGKVALSGA